MISTFVNPTLEWKTLAALANKESDLVTKLRPDLFTNDRYALFDAMRQAYTVYGEITPETIEVYLKKPCPSEIDVPYGTNIEAAITDLQRLAIKRQLKSKAEHLAAIADEHDPNLDTVLDVLQFSPMTDDQDSSLDDGMHMFLANLQRKLDGGYKFVSTGYKTLDLYLNGEWPIGLTLLGGLPGTGKTAFSFDSMLKMAIQNDTKSLLICQEMLKSQIIARGIANLANIDSDDLALGNLTDEEKQRVESTAQRILSLPIHIIDTPVLNVMQIIGIIKDHVRLGVKVVFIDHLQLIATQNDNRNHALGEIAWALKSCSKNLGVRIILLTQLTDKAGGYVVRDSGEVESKADTFIIMDSESKEMCRDIGYAFKKNRDGKLGQFSMLFNSRFQRFEDDRRY